MIRQFQGVLKIDEYANRRKLFVNDNTADIFYLIDGKLRPSHKKFLMESAYFARKILSKNQFVIEID